MDGPGRRDVLRTAAMLSVAGVAGCFGTLPGRPGGSPRDERPESPSPDRETTGRGLTTRTDGTTTTGRTKGTPTRTPPDCRTLLPRPDGETNEGLEPVSYPDFPGTLTEDAAAEFAVAFDRAYRWNEIVQWVLEGEAAGDPGTSGTETISVDNHAVATPPLESGFAVLVNGTEYSNGADAVAATWPYTWWYRVSRDRIAGMRAVFDAAVRSAGLRRSGTRLLSMNVGSDRRTDCIYISWSDTIGYVRELRLRHDEFEGRTDRDARGGDGFIGRGDRDGCRGVQGRSTVGR